MFDFLRRHKDENKELKQATFHGILSGEAQRGLTEHEMAEQLGINVHMIEDTDINNMLNQLAVQKKKNGDGSIESEFDFDVLALRVLASKLIRTSYVDPIDVTIAQLEIECLINRVEMNMDEDTYEYGGTNLLEALAKLIQTSWSDAKDGRKAKLLKEVWRKFQIGMTEKQ